MAQSLKKKKKTLCTRSNLSGRRAPFSGGTSSLLLVNRAAIKKTGLVHGKQVGRRDNGK